MIVVTGANGQLGRAVVEHLLRQQPAPQVRVSVRDPQRAAALAARGVDVRPADFDNPEQMRAAFDGADRLLLISGDSPVEQRTRQHRNAIDAAQAAGVHQVVYTSMQGVAPDSPFPFAAIHADTEAYLRGSGLAWTFLRNGFYAEVPLMFAGEAKRTGTLAVSAGDGRVAFAVRDDLAKAAAAVLTGPGHEGELYTLTGPAAYSFGEIANVLTEIWGCPIRFADVTSEQFAGGMQAAGLPPFMVDAMVGMAKGMREGRHAEVTDDLRQLTGAAPKDGLSLIRKAAAAL